MRAYQRKDTVKPFGEMRAAAARARGGAGAAATNDESASLLSSMSNPVHDGEPRAIEMAARGGGGDVGVDVAADEEDLDEEEKKASHMVKRLKEAVGLRPKGLEVAVKIVHPHIREKVGASSAKKGGGARKRHGD